MTTPTTEARLWDELVMHALASDGPIRDADVKDAVRIYRPKIEAEARRRVLAGLGRAIDEHILEVGSRGHLCDHTCAEGIRAILDEFAEAEE